MGQLFRPRDGCGALPPVILERGEREQPEDREERRDEQPGADRPALGEHDQAAEERPDDVEGEADGEAGRDGALPEAR